MKTLVIFTVLALTLSLFTGTLGMTVIGVSIVWFVWWITGLIDDEMERQRRIGRKEGRGGIDDDTDV